jgi:RHS repeat-associated protein
VEAKKFFDVFLKIGGSGFFWKLVKIFELSNHLGNVLVTVSDKKLAVSANGTTIDYYTADVVTASDYFPFGSQMPGRKFSQPNSSYRYGFNGKEQDKETTGTSTYDYGFRIYNPALGRFLSVDPLTKTYPALTPYQFASNNPVEGIDLDGLEYLSSKVARIQVVNGIVMLKVDNMTSVVKKALKAYNESHASSFDANGNPTIGADFSVGKIDIAGTLPQFPSSDPEEDDAKPNHREDKTEVGKPKTQKGLTDKRYKDRSVTTASPSGAKGFAYLQIAMMVIESGVNLYMQNAQKNENALVSKHIGVFKLAAADVNYALKNSTLIPKEFQTTQYISDIINVVLSGESYVSKYDEATGAKLKQIGIAIYNKYSVKRTASTTQTVETSGLDGISIKKTVTTPNPAYDANYVQQNPAIGEEPKK